MRKGFLHHSLLLRSTDLCNEPKSYRTLKTRTYCARGFTLIELSIVLIIIGLLVGGVLGGRDLIRQAQIRSVISEVNQYKTVLNSFDLKYDAVPGDMDNATSFWSGTANGNGDRRVVGTIEIPDFWQHLSLAGMVDGVYSGVIGVGVNQYNTSNMPGSSLDSALYAPGFTTNTRYGMAGTTIGNYFFYGASRDLDGYPSGALLSAQEAQNLDSKMDDGLADQGRTWVLKAIDSGGYTGNCVANNWSETSAGAYDFSVDTAECHMLFRF